MAPRTKYIRLMASAALALTAIIWGSGFVVMKDALDGVEPFTLIAMRFTLGALILSAVFARRLMHAGRRALAKGGLIGVVMFAAYIVQTFGLKDTTPGKNAFLTTIYCVLVPFMFWMTGGRRPDAGNLAAAALMVTGVGLVSINDALQVGRGDALSLVGGVLFAVQIVMIGRFARDEDPFVLTVAQFVTCAALGWIFSAATGGLSGGIASLGGSVWQLLYLSVVCTALALLMQNVGQKYTDPSAASIIMGLEAVFGVVFSIIFYSEVVTLRLVAGFALIFLAVLVSELRPARRRKDIAPPAN